ncbi:hypothetical protein [Brevibacillus porteri]|uniref:hypothetical protein n=1 Tax=Brevibacillus porteri TaxID=2126350 RepID=UPI003643034F
MTDTQAAALGLNPSLRGQYEFNKDWSAMYTRSFKCNILYKYIKTRKTRPSLCIGGFFAAAIPRFNLSWVHPPLAKQKKSYTKGIWIRNSPLSSGNLMFIYSINLNKFEMKFLIKLKIKFLLSFYHYY